MPSITSANSIFLLAVDGLFAAPQQMIGYDVDDAFGAEPTNVAEVKIGVDGILSAGFIYETTDFEFTLQADSPSVGLIETWYAQQRAIQDVLLAQGIIRQPSIGRSYVLSNGALVGYSTFSPAKKVLQPRRFMLKWESVLGAPI